MVFLIVSGVCWVERSSCFGIVFLFSFFRCWSNVVTIEMEREPEKVSGVLRECLGDSMVGLLHRLTNRIPEFELYGSILLSAIVAGPADMNMRG